MNFQDMSYDRALNKKFQVNNQKHMSKSVYFSLVYKNEKLEATQVSWLFTALSFRKKLYY